MFKKFKIKVKNLKCIVGFWLFSCQNILQHSNSVLRFDFYVYHHTQTQETGQNVG
jgi:hypothetical protein